ncbi:DEAD/DEAH box helicase family protein [Orrella marina]|nr:DEAD/DEAH box helicase family protein [Orrella marina]
MAAANVSSFLVTGGEHHQLLPALRRALVQATEIEIAVSFIRKTGLDLIFGDLEAALLSESRHVRLAVLTSDYLSVTDPIALRQLMLLAERGADIRVFQTGPGDSFHLKAYIFVKSEQGAMVSADVFVGSSNLSKKALTDGLEWNYHLSYPDEHDPSSDKRVAQVRQGFATLNQHPQVVPLSSVWIDEYQTRYDNARKIVPIDVVRPEVDVASPGKPTPRPHQVSALEALKLARARGLRKGLVVLATGLGKTYLAAFDAIQAGAKRVLFVAHREEILLQAQVSFLNVMPDQRIGRFTGKQKDDHVDLLFASVQTLARESHLERFGRDHFDYIVVDEFHHAAAGTYQKLLSYFEPEFLLGLTATPDRSDGSDILHLCDNNLIFRFDLFDGIEADQLCPFSYYGIFDRDVDYQHIPWRNGRFDPDSLFAQLATRSRARHVFNEWKSRAKSRTLAFCASQKHADYMADFFQHAGVPALSVHSDSQVTRSQALHQLARAVVRVVFSVDLFNEGVDLPEIDTVMMLRPTESRVLFLQQLGRGLRLSDTKDRLVVVDFVGNHHSFLNRPELLLGHQFAHKPSRRELVSYLHRSDLKLAKGCFVNYDLGFIEFLDGLVKDRLDRQYTATRASLGRRPTITELAQTGVNLTNLRRNHGSWWEYLDEQGDATPDEMAVIERHAQWFRDLTVTRVVRSYKLILLKTLISREKLDQEVAIDSLAVWGKDWFLRNPAWQRDLPASLQPLSSLSDRRWANQWKKMPVHYWCTPEPGSAIAWFASDGSVFRFTQTVLPDETGTLSRMTDEIVNWRLGQYGQSLFADSASDGEWR